MGDCTFNESDFDVPVRSLRNDARAMLCPALIHRALLAGELGQGSATARYAPLVLHPRRGRDQASPSTGACPPSLQSRMHETSLSAPTVLRQHSPVFLFGELRPTCGSRCFGADTASDTAPGGVRSR
eukprot:2078380-Rhodomonas_salina.4